MRASSCRPSWVLWALMLHSLLGIGSAGRPNRKAVLATPAPLKVHHPLPIAAIDQKYAHSGGKPLKTAGSHLISKSSHAGKSRLEGAAQSTAKGGVASQGHKAVHDHYVASKGHEGKEIVKNQHQEHGAKKHATSGGGGHQQQQHDAAHGQHGFKYKGHDGHSKSGFTKGYRDKYHKDEYHKLDKYWSNANQKGQYEKFGEHGNHFHKEGGKHFKGGKETKSAQVEQHGKKGQTAKGHQSSDHKGHKGHKGQEKQTAHQSEYAKKGSSKGQHSFKVHP